MAPRLDRRQGGRVAAGVAWGSNEGAEVFIPAAERSRAIRVGPKPVMPPNRLVRRGINGFDIGDGNAGLMARLRNWLRALQA